MHERFRRKVLGKVAAAVSRRPRWTLAATFAVAAGCVAVTVYGLPMFGVAPLQFQSDRNALIAEELPWNQNFIAWNDQFRGTRDLTVVIDPGPGDESAAAAAGGGGGVHGDGHDHRAMGSDDRAARARQVADELGARLTALEQVERAVWRFRPQSARALRMAAMPQFQAHLAMMVSARPILEAPTLHLLLSPQQLIGQMAQGGGEVGSSHTGGDVAAFVELLDAVNQSLAGDGPAPAALEAHLTHVDWQYFTGESCRLHFIRVTPVRDVESLNDMGDAITAIRRTIAQVTGEHPGVEVGLTGIEVVEADETNAAMTDSIIASIVAVTLIAGLLIGAFHSWRTPLIAVVALLVAIACTFGYLTVTIGHLQVISVVFAVILLGLGIGYAIHIITRYELVRRTFDDDAAGFGSAMGDSLMTTGPGIITGAVTTAAAFATTMFTDFRGVAEMGHVAAAGIFICVIIMFTAFPALMRVFKPKRKHVRSMKRRYFHLFEERWLTPFFRRPLLTCLIALGLAGAAVWATSRMKYDYDLMALLPDNVDSVMWQERVADVSGRSIWFGVSRANDLAQVRRLAAMFRKLETVEPEIGGVGLLLPHDEQQKIGMLEEAGAKLRPAVAAVLNGAASPADKTAPAGDVIANLGALKVMLSLAGENQIAAADRQAIDAAIGRIVKTAGRLDQAARQQRVAAVEQQYARGRQRLAAMIDQALDTEPLTLADLPGELHSMYVGSDGSLAMELYPKLPAAAGASSSPLSPDFLPRFVGDLRRVDPAVTGVIVQVFESGDLIYNAYVMAGMWAFMIVLVLLYIDFQSLIDALMCLLPVLIGFAVTFGLMYVFGMHINPANIIVLPLVFGIGVDAGVHIMHRYRQDALTRPIGLTAGTGKGITLTSLTTMIGFGALMLASHRGIRSLGFVLATGVGMTMIACWIVMPACLELRARGRKGSGSVTSEPAAAEPNESKVRAVG